MLYFHPLIFVQPQRIFQVLFWRIFYFSLGNSFSKIILFFKIILNFLYFLIILKFYLSIFIDFTRQYFDFFFLNFSRNFSFEVSHLVIFLKPSILFCFLFLHYLISFCLIIFIHFAYSSIFSYLMPKLILLFHLSFLIEFLKFIHLRLHQFELKNHSLS